MSTSTGRRILYCHCAFAQVVPPVTKSMVLEQLSASGVTFDAVPDLCEMAARRDPGLAAIASNEETTIVACYPRAVKWLFNAAGTPLAEGVRILNMRASEAPEILSELELPLEQERS